MAFTNTTTNYKLPQYVPDDKPKYLTDFNKAMEDIDTNMKKIEDKADTNTSTVNGLLGSLSSIEETASQAEETAQNADTNATQAKTNADSAITIATETNDIIKSFFEGFNNVDSWKLTD